MKKLSAWMLAGAMALSLSGCKTWTLSSPSNWLKGSIVESKFESPERMVVIWAEDVMTVPGREPTRGFGGRIYFYNAADKTIPVEGQLIVYGYDDSVKQNGAQRTPDRKFAFTADEFKKHFGDSQLGPSYSIWVPWDAAGGEQKEVSLVPVFTSSQGKMVMGALNTNVLKGRSKDSQQRPHNQIEVTRSTTIDPPARPRTEFDRLQENSRAVEQSFARQTAYSQQVLDSTANDLTRSNQVNSPVPNAGPIGPGSSTNSFADGHSRVRTTTINMTRSLSQQMQNTGASELPENTSDQTGGPTAKATPNVPNGTGSVDFYQGRPAGVAPTTPTKPTSAIWQNPATLPGGFNPPASLQNVTGYQQTPSFTAGKSGDSTNRTPAPVDSTMNP